MKKTLIKYPFLTQDVEVYEQENGHKIVLAHKEGGLVNISSWVKTGSINETADNNGISHFLEHLMFKGTHKHRAGDFDRILEAKGAIVNAATWKDYTFYYVTLPKGENNKDFNEALELHADMMLDPILPPEEIGAPFSLNDKAVKDKRERHVVIEEIRMRDDQPWTKVYNAVNEGMYTEHPYRRDVIGTPKIISKVSQQEIMNYYKHFYTPENITTIVVGDFDSDEILEKIKTEFNWNGRKNNEKRVNKSDVPTQRTKIIENRARINSAFLMSGWLGPRAIELRDGISLDMLNIILGEGNSSRLYQNLIEKRTDVVFNAISSEHYQFRDGSNFFIQANFVPKKRDIALELIEAEVAELTARRVTEAEFKKAKKKIKSKFAFNAETVSEIGETIGYYMTVCDSLTPVEDYLKVLNEITPDVLLEVAGKYLKLENAVISTLMPEE